MNALPVAAPSVLHPITCAPLLSGSPLSEADAVQLAGALKALADPARLRILSLIAAQPSADACVCHLTDALDLAQPTISHHLKVLFEAGLVTRERRGTWIYYRVVPSALRSLVTVLAAEPAVVPTSAGAACDTGCACA